jgi:hypothetical protein
MFSRKSPELTPQNPAVWRGWTAEALAPFLERKAERWQNVRTLSITSVELHALSMSKDERPKNNELKLTGHYNRFTTWNRS